MPFCSTPPQSPTELYFIIVTASTVSALRENLDCFRLLKCPKNFTVDSACTLYTRDF